jgi:hypothetical protein
VLDIRNHHATVDGFAHVVECEKGNLDRGEKPRKNKEKPKKLKSQLRLFSLPAKLAAAILSAVLTFAIKGW